MKIHCVSGGSADLFALLGIAPDISNDRLRAAYEGAVESATRRGDWDRARELSAAFDALDASQRKAVYSGHGGHARRWETGPASTRRPRHRRERRAKRRPASSRQARRAARDAELTARWHMRRPYRIAARLILWLTCASTLASWQSSSQRQATWPVLAISAASPLLCWLGLTIAGQLLRRRFQYLLEIVAWSSVAGLVLLIAILSYANTAQP